MNVDAEYGSESNALDLTAYWMPFTHNRLYKKRPHMLTHAEGAYYFTDDGKRLFDCLSGLWCCGLGHAHPGIAHAVSQQASQLDYAPAFQLGHPKVFMLAERISGMAPAGLTHVFFANSGSEAVDTALKVALGYHRVRGEGQRTRFVGRERSYHGVGFGGMSVGGIAANRKMFAGALLPHVDHLPHTHNSDKAGFSRGQPIWGADLAGELERVVALHDASTIAAVIVEPMAGSTGVLPPPIGYLERLRAICDHHGILLIFDEVITGFGRLGANFAAQRFGVTPDLICFAKAVTNGVIPMGGVVAKQKVFDAFMTGPELSLEFYHGYTYSGHPMAVAAAHAALDAFRDEGVLDRAAELEPVLQDVLHDLKGELGILDIRNIGLAGAFDLEPVPGQPGLRGRQVFERGLEEGILLRFTGDTIAVAPPFISSRTDIERMGEAIRRALRRSCQ
jgi:beta-alanine--pyruvate transaminase